jgi:uncharacterized protein YrrD
MMKSQHVNGLTVVSIASGERLGSVSEMLLDTENRRVMAFVVGGGGGLLSTQPSQPRYLAAEDVHAIGPDALTVQDGSALRETPPQTGSPLSDLLKLRVVTEGGTAVGPVAALEFDERSMRVTELEVSSGFFKSNTMVPASEIISVGPELVVISDRVVAEPPSADEQVAESGVIVVDDQRTGRAEA